MSERAKFYRRQFLNPADGLAAVEATVQDANKEGRFDAEFVVRDCDRTVTLDFRVYDREDLAKMRAKMERLYRAVRAMRAAYLLALDDADERLTS